MSRRVYDSRLLQFFVHALQRLEGYTPAGRLSAGIKLIVVEILRLGHARLESAVEAAGDEQREAGKAGDALDMVEADSEEVFERVYNALVSDYYARKARRETSNDTHTVALDRFVQGYAPSDYATSSPATKVGVIGEAARLAGHFLAANWSGLADEVAKAHANLSDAVENYQAEVGESDDSLLERDNAFDDARRFYMAGRDLLSAALRLDEKFDLLGKWAPPVSDIRTSLSPEIAKAGADAAPSEAAAETEPS
jgi:hypothetical protein